MTDSTHVHVPIAIISMAWRPSGDVTNPSEIWELYVSGRDGHTPIPEDRIDAKGPYHKDKGRVGGRSVEGGYFLKQDNSLFDATFFNLSSDAAAVLDQQQSLLLKTVYEATEEAGIPIEKLASTNTSVYTGTVNKDYHEIQSKDAETLPLSSLFGTGTAMLSNRISHFFDLRRPSIPIDTDDSAGIVAVHQAPGGLIEAEAIARTFGRRRDETDSAIIGSVNTTLGHTGSVSGIAALIKAVFVLKHRAIPPYLNFQNTSPNLKVLTVVAAWPQDRPLRVSVSNFGDGGTNGHIILDLPSNNRDPSGSLDSDNHPEGHSTDTGCTSNRSFVYLLSAKDSTACTTFMRQITHYIVKSRPRPEDLAYTLAERRSRHSWVTAVRARSIDELATCLLSPTREPFNTPPELPELGFVFNGPDAQWHAMGRELIEAYPIFGQRIREADDILREYGALWSLKEELMREKITTRVAEIQLSQPISVAVQLCLADLLEPWGILPTAVTSHSSGEIAAAYAVKILSFKEALSVAYFRSELCFQKQKLHSLRGGMIVAAVSSAVAEKYIASASAPGGHVVVACINSPFHVTYSGDSDALEEVANKLKDDDIIVGKLKAPMAYHSHHMRHMEREYIEKLRPILRAVTRKQAGCDTTIISPVTGEHVSPSVLLNPEHWARNMTSPVLFSQAFNNMIGDIDMVVEIGAHSILATPIRQILRDRNIERPYTSCLSRMVDAVDTMQDMACELISRGYPVNLRQVNSPLGVEGQQQSHRLVTNLPSYPWNHTR